MHIEFLLEERSAEAALETLLPKIVSESVSRNIRVFQGKYDLLKQLPNRLKAYRESMQNNRRFMVLIDKDRQDCMELKATLENIAHEAGFLTKSSAGSAGEIQVVNRLAIEELEAWYLGDYEAVRTAYPKVPRLRQCQNPDAVIGPTKVLERMLRQSNYHRGGLPKTAVARSIAQHMDPNRNRSKSFQMFIEGLKACVGEGGLRNQ